MCVQLLVVVTGCVPMSVDGGVGIRLAKFFYVKGSHRPRPLTRFECFEYAKRRGHGRRVHAPHSPTCQPPFVSSKVTSDC